MKRKKEPFLSKEQLDLIYKNHTKITIRPTKIKSHKDRELHRKPINTKTMKAIELTEEHKSRLLEMCTLLFPENIFGFTNDIADEGIMECHQGDWNNVIFFHWFEFCIMHLIPKLYNISNLKNESSLKQLRGYVCQNTEHPVDYLYDEFKILKLKN